jgi:hypothetical protein
MGTGGGLLGSRDLTDDTGVDGALLMPIPRPRDESCERLNFEIMRCRRLPLLADLVVGVRELTLSVAERTGWSSGGGPSSRKEIRSFVAFETGYNRPRPRAV